MSTADDPERSTAVRLPRASVLLVGFELLILLVAALWATSAYFPQADRQLPGYEAEWLTSPAYLSAESFRTNGYLPLWQPYLGSGQPTFEHPFSFLLNPINTLPSLAVGAQDGLLISVILSVILTGWSGWLLGRLLGFGTLGRVLLGLLCIGKGNLHAMLGAGNFQLGTAQAYLPLILAGTVALFRFRDRRWPIVLTAVAFTLLWWTGGLWYVLPTLIMILLVLGFQTFRRDGKRILVDGAVIRRTVWMLALTVGLCTVTWLPLSANQTSLVIQSRADQTSTSVDTLRVIEQFFNGDPALYDRGLAPGLPQVFYSYVFPWWLLILIVVLLPIRWLNAAPFPQTWRIWLPALLIIGYCVVWAAGSAPLLDYFARNFTALGYWHFAGRALALASLWIAILVALRLDGLWRAVVVKATWIKRMPNVDQVESFKPLLAALLVLLAAVSAFDVLNMWSAFLQQQPTRRDTQLTKTFDDDCLGWLRGQQVGLQSVLGPLDYSSVLAYTTNGLRRSNLDVDIEFAAQPSTLYAGDLLRLSPRYAVAQDEAQRATLKQRGYLELRASPPTENRTPCLYLKPNAVSYAYAIPSRVLGGYSDLNPLINLHTTPIQRVWHGADRIGLVVDALPSDSLVVTVQEITYPGWHVWVNDQAATLESVGGQIGVVIPPGNGAVKVYFQYLPSVFFNGAWITLIVAGIGVLYLLRMDRLLPPSFLRWLGELGAAFQTWLGKAIASLGRSLTQSIDDKQE